MCYQPITIKTPQGYRTVPCGKCLECLRKYQSDWSNRMYEELKSHDGKGVFFTLTYDDNNVPKNYLYYADATHFEVFRSPSDYGYDNTYTDEKGRTKVLPDRKGERKHFRVAPDVELRETGLDPKIIDFNVQRKEREKFRDTIQNIYGTYLRTITAPVVYAESGIDCTADISDNFFDFDNYDGDLFFHKTDLDKSEELVFDLFTEALNDEYFEDKVKDKSNEDETVAQSVISRCEEVQGVFRERPVMMFNSVRKKDVQDWIKRARQRRKRIAQKTGKPEQEFAFFITSEYGPRTLRPHYHGVLFGVTAQEAMDMAKDWQRHHGERISWEDIDLSKGDMSYCAKYCSKGFYEHPLCSKDFFYFKSSKVLKDDGTYDTLRPFTEYHSKHYERCIEIFGVDYPIVDPTFHLISKGFGVDWVEDHKYLVKDFEDISEFFDGTADVVFVETYAPWEDRFKELDVPVDNVGFKSKKIIKIMKHECSKDYEECIERLFKQFKYYRTFKGEVIAYGVPKYYRTKIFSDGLRAAFANYVQQVNVELYKEKLDALRAQDPLREDTENVLMLERQEQQERYNRMRDCKKRLDKIYNKSKI